MANESAQSSALNKIALEVVTPRGKALAVSADEVTAPSVQGEFGVMPGHLPLLAALRTGLVTYRQGGETTRVAVGPGFAEVSANKLLILTDHYVEKAQIDPVIIRKELAEVQGQLAKAVSNGQSLEAGGAGALPEADALIKQENWLAAQLELYGDPPPAAMRPFEQYGPTPPPEDSDTPTDAPSDKDEAK